VLNGSSPLSGASVTITLKKPNNTTTTITGTTGSNGVALASYKIKKTDPKGTWNVVATSTGATGSTSFTVQ
jgi:uncharacterized protein YfaS (alpha-2-macroglobulin family)